MRRVFPVALMSLAFVAAGAFSLLRAADEKPKHTIKDVMKAHKKLRDKVLDGSASADDKKKLSELYAELGENDPPKGDKANWKKLTEALAKAAGIRTKK